MFMIVVTLLYTVCTYEGVEIMHAMEAPLLSFFKVLIPHIIKTIFFKSA